MPKKRNREIIMEQSMYDLLCKMNEQLDKNTHCVCIMECFMQSTEAESRCKDFQMKCTDCIQAWMNEFPF